MRLLCVLSLVCAVRAASAERYSEHPASGFTLAAGAGGNVGTPFVEAQVGRRFTRAPFLELYLDYSYDRPISEAAFHTGGLGARTYFAHVGRFELYLQTLAAFAVSEGGHLRTLGDRLLGPFFAEGLGIAYAFDERWSLATTLSTGDPVWLRYTADLRFAF